MGLLTGIIDLRRLASVLPERTRAEPERFIAQMQHYAAGLTSLSVADEVIERAVSLKALYGIWNYVVDAEIDERDDIIAPKESIDLLRHHHCAAAPHPATQILARIIELASNYVRSPAYQRLRDDLLRISEAFLHTATRKTAHQRLEREFADHHLWLASILPHLDIDLMVRDGSEGAHRLDGCSHDLRAGYEALGAALRYANDVGSLRRDIHEATGEIPSNFVVFDALREHRSPLEHWSELQIQPQRLSTLASALRRRVEDCMNVAIARLEPLDHVHETHRVRATVRVLVDHHLRSGGEVV